MNVIKGKNFKSGTFKGEEHSYIDSINATINSLGEYGPVLPVEKKYYFNPARDADDIRTHHDEGGALIKKYVPLVHRDLGLILYRGICYVLSGVESTMTIIEADVMKLIQNIDRVVGSKITEIHHMAQLNEAYESLDDSYYVCENAQMYQVPTSYDATYDINDKTDDINLFDTNGETPLGQQNVIQEAIKNTTHLIQARDVIGMIAKGVNGISNIAKSVHSNDSHPEKSHGGLRLGYLSDALDRMFQGLQEIRNSISEECEARKYSGKEVE